MVVGVLASLGLAKLVDRFNYLQLNDAVTSAAEQTAEALVNRLKIYQYGLRGARGSIQTMGENAINRKSFDSYSRTRNVDEEFPGARGFGFIRRVSQQGEREFLLQAQADGWPEFALRQFEPHDGERFIIQYISPIERNRVAIGLDIASETNRRAAALASMRSGEARLTAPITLVQLTGTGKPLQSFLLLMPIYRGGVTPDTVEAREAQTLGWSYTPLSMDEVLQGLLRDDQGSSIELSDVSDPTQPVVFFKSKDVLNQNVTFSKTLERDIYGRHWRIEFDVNELFIKKLHQLSPHLVFIVGLFLSVLIASLIGVLTLSRLRQRQIIAEQQKLAAIVESSADGIIGKDLDGVVISWNKGAEKLFGFSSDEAIGCRIFDLVVPIELEAEESKILLSIKQGVPIPSFNTQRKHKNGNLIPVSVTVSPIRNSAGVVVGASKTVRDNSAQVASEAKINELNTSLEAQVVQRTFELRQLNLLLGNVLHSASEVAIIATDIEGTIRIFNTGAERMLGYNAGELVDKSTPASFHLDEEVVGRAHELSDEYGLQIEGFRAFVHKAELLGAETREWTYVRKDGSRLPVSLAVTAIRDENNEINGYLGVAVDLSIRKASENALASARDQLQMAAEVAELGIWSWTVADSSLSWNNRMFELYGQPLSLRETGLRYEHWRERVHPGDAAIVESKLRLAVSGTGIYDPVFRVVRPDGQVRVVQAGAQVERDAMGVAIRVTGINRDITAQRELESRLLSAKEQADAASAAKSSFVANMSHEIRTPMNAVLGMLHLVQNTQLNTRQLDYISKAESAAKSLLGLLNDVLDYSKIDAGKFQLDLHEFDLEMLIRDLAVVLSGNQGQKDVEVLFDLKPDLPRAVIGDSMRLQQVLINLAGNALKFTQRGNVIVKVQELQRLGEVVQVLFEVTDTGIGIDRDQLTRIFDGFTQAEASTNRRFGGTGLGLVISKRLISLMGGELRVSSEVGVGSRFWFEIELGISPTSPVLGLRPNVDGPLRLLVADDNEVAGHLMARMAQGLGCQADMVKDGLQAVARVKQMGAENKPYDLILMDWRMPHMDGLRAAQLIRSQAPGQHAPVIIMTTAFGREALADVQQEGDPPFADVLSKPITPQQLADSIQLVMNGEGALQCSMLKPEQPRLPRLNGMRLLVVEDNMLNRQVAFELLQGEGAQVTLAEGGLEGVRQATENALAFDAVLMDVQMPDIDGMEATRRIRADARSQAITIIAMTANVSNTDEQACRAAGMNDHLGKPIDLEKMVATLRRHAGYESTEPPEQVQSPTEDGLLEPLSAISQRFGGNHQLIQTLLGIFLKDQTKQLQRLQEQVQELDSVGATAVLHAIKGSSATMGARAMSQFAGGLEQQLLEGDEATKLQLLANIPVVETLRQLCSASEEALRAMFNFGNSEPMTIHAVNDCLTVEDWSTELKQILLLLEVGNIQALAQSKALQLQTPHQLRSQFDVFFDLVQSLDFPASLLTGHELLKRSKEL